MFFFKYLIPSLIFLLPVISYGEINFIGLDQNGREVMIKEKGNEMSSRLFHLLKSFETKVGEVEAINQKNNDKKLTKIRLGFSVGAALGLGNVIEATSMAGGFAIFDRINK